MTEQKKQVAVVGAGTMGKQIAVLYASRGYTAVLWDYKNRSDSTIKELKRLATLNSKLGLISKDKINDILEIIYYTVDLADIEKADLVIEAVIEDRSIKKNILLEIENVIHESTILGSNTSTLSITELSSSLQKPARFLGIHFFNPVLSSNLVEVVKGIHSSAEVVESVHHVLSHLDKAPVILKDTPGFVVNRLLFLMINEAISMLSEGVAAPEVIDKCMRDGAGHKMGPLELADFIGLDICLRSIENLYTETSDSKYRPVPLLKEYVQSGKLGRKSGVGFYAYSKKG